MINRQCKYRGKRRKRGERKTKTEIEGQNGDQIISTVLRGPNLLNPALSMTRCAQYEIQSGGECMGEKTNVQ